MRASVMHRSPGYLPDRCQHHRVQRSPAARTASIRPIRFPARPADRSPAPHARTRSTSPSAPRNRAARHRRTLRPAGASCAIRPGRQATGRPWEGALRRFAPQARGRCSPGVCRPDRTPGRRQSARTAPTSLRQRPQPIAGDAQLVACSVGNTLPKGALHHGASGRTADTGRRQVVSSFPYRSLLARSGRPACPAGFRSVANRSQCLHKDSGVHSQRGHSAR